jgi:hypothetical protein
MIDVRNYLKFEAKIKLRWPSRACSNAVHIAYSV